MFTCIKYLLRTELISIGIVAQKVFDFFFLMFCNVLITLTFRLVLFSVLSSFMLFTHFKTFLLYLRVLNLLISSN